MLEKLLYSIMIGKKIQVYLGTERLDSMNKSNLDQELLKDYISDKNITFKTI
jgi:hypothetical protein